MLHRGVILRLCNRLITSPLKIPLFHFSKELCFHDFKEENGSRYHGVDQGGG